MTQPSVGSGPGPLSAADFEFVRALVLKNSGIALGADRRYLVESRLAPIVRQEKMAHLPALIEHLRLRQSGPLVDRVVDAMTTNETSFFRDLHPFEVLRTDLIPAMAAEAEQRPLRIWSAACSSGQEAMSIAMIFNQHFPRLVDNTRIIGTDVSSEMVERARKGRFSQLEIDRGLPPALRDRFFKADGDGWVASPALLKMTEFRRMNLLTDPIQDTFDLVMLRNVLIYFTEDTKKLVLNRIHRAMRPKACLFLGGAETIIGLDVGFELKRFGKTICYQRT